MKGYAASTPTIIQALTCIAIFVCEGAGALARPLVLLPLALIGIAIGVDAPTLAMPLPLEPLTNVLVACLKMASSCTQGVGSAVPWNAVLALEQQRGMPFDVTGV